MLTRHLAAVAFAPGFGRQMRFIVGPRQAGKTSMARAFLRASGSDRLYYNWDQEAVQDRRRRDPYFYWSDAFVLRKSRPWVCFDEIHKTRHWKNLLKDGFDRFERRLRFVVTGSASMDLRRKAGDSLAGRFFTFHLNPLTLGEALRRPAPRPFATGQAWLEARLDESPVSGDAVGAMLAFGPFPEPFLKHRVAFRNRWAGDYLDRLIRGDMRDLTPLSDLHAIEELVRLLPERVGSPLSMRSLLEDLRIAHPTVVRHLAVLADFFLVFPVPPWARSIARAIRRERKFYFYDCARVPDPAARFENLVAMELKARCDLWTGGGSARFDLHYVRTRDGKETDFLLTRDEKPWVLVECKMADGPVAFHHRAHAAALGAVPVIQVCREPGIRIVGPDGTCRLSAGALF